MEYRWSGEDISRSHAQAAELVGLKPDVIVASTTASLAAVRQETKVVPIVFSSVSDPVAQGFVANLAHPGGNITGFSAYEFSIGSKWLDLLKQIAPDLAHVGQMFNPTTSPQYKFFLGSIKAAAQSVGMDVTPLPIHDKSEIEPAIATLAGRPNSGLIVATDNFLISNRNRIVDLAARTRLPAIYAISEFVKSGGLMSYAVNITETYRGAAFYVDRILKGAKPGDLPVQMANKYTLTINLKAAKALDLKLPMSLMLSADEVIE